MENKKIILVIEDEKVLLDVISQKLEIRGLTPISCTGGKQAIDYLENNSKTPDAIWLDYYLKDMNGLDFMKFVKSNQKFSQIPVIVVSNSAHPDKIKNMLALGAIHYLVKTEHTLDDIINIVRELVFKKASERS